MTAWPAESVAIEGEVWSYKDAPFESALPESELTLMSAGEPAEGHWGVPA